MNKSNFIKRLFLNFFSVPRGPTGAVIGIAVLLAFAVTGANAQEPSSVDSARMPELSAAQRAPAHRIPARDWAPEEIHLAPLENAEMQAGMPAVAKPGPLQLGFSRSVIALENAEDFASRQVWHPTPKGGQAFGFLVTSPEAQALRLGLRVGAIPDEAVVRFYAPDKQQVFAVSGADIKATLQRNLNAGETGEDAATYWSPVVDGEHLLLEVELPAGTDPSAVDMAAPRVSHLFQSPLSDNFFQSKAAGACNLDITCYPGLNALSNATARMVYTKSGSSYLCTGTLMNDKDATSWVPYFLSANHCFSTHSEASTLQTYWFYRSASCGGAAGPYQTLAGGATLLYATESTDTLFVRLLENPPAGAYFAGWTAGLPTMDMGITGVHHPAGDLQKVSYGNLKGYCLDRDGTSCSTTDATNALFYKLLWTNGVTEGGSSGSGIFNSDARLIGTLFGGKSSCDNPASPDFYGRFDTAYYAGLQKWLSPGSNDFADVPPTHWAYRYINAIRAAGITGGCGNGNYCPQDLVPRDQMAAFLIRAKVGEPPSDYCGTTSPFSDVAPTSLFCRYIKRLVELSITGGCGGSYYCPSDLVTREQMAVFIVRAKVGEPPANYCGGVSPFNDVAANSWSCGYIKKLVELKVTLGCGNGSYCPNDTVPRDQMAAFLARAFLSMD